MFEIESFIWINQLLKLEIERPARCGEDLIYDARCTSSTKEMWDYPCYDERKGLSDWNETVEFELKGKLESVS